MDHNETRTIVDLTQNGSPDRETAVSSEDGTKRDGGAAPTARAARGWSGAKQRIAFLIVALVVCVACGLYYLRFIAPFESTDDAFIEGHVTQVAPQVAGRIARVLVNDNQFVNAGEMLVQIEPSDYEAALQKERANLASAQSRLAQAGAQLTVDQAKAEQERANVLAAQAEATRAETDSKRYDAIGTSGVSQSQIDLAATQARSTAAILTAARNKELAAEAQVSLDQASIQTAGAEVKRSEAAAHQAELDLSYTEVKAQESGYITRKTVEVGSYVQPGQALLAIVQRDVWVVANGVTSNRMTW